MAASISATERRSSSPSSTATPALDDVGRVEHFCGQCSAGVLPHHDEMQAATGVRRIGEEVQVVLDDRLVDGQRRDVDDLQLGVGQEESRAQQALLVVLDGDN